VHAHRYTGGFGLLCGKGGHHFAKPYAQGMEAIIGKNFRNERGIFERDGRPGHTPPNETTDTAAADDACSHDQSAH